MFFDRSASAVSWPASAFLASGVAEPANSSAKTLRTFATAAFRSAADGRATAGLVASAAGFVVTEMRSASSKSPARSCDVTGWDRPSVPKPKTNVEIMTLIRRMRCENVIRV